MQMSKIGDMAYKNLKIRVDVRAGDAAFDSLSIHRSRNGNIQVKTH